MKFIKIDNVVKEEFKLKNNDPLKVLNRSVMLTHSDTDSVYLCFNEAITRLKEEGIHFETENQKRLVYSKIEDVLQTFFNRVLEIRAEKSHTTNKIKFNRENIFTNMFCFAKKLYIGSVIDSEGAKYPFDKPKHKIMRCATKKVRYA